MFCWPSDVGRGRGGLVLLFSHRLKLKLKLQGVQVETKMKGLVGCKSVEVLKEFVSLCYTLSSILQSCANVIYSS